MVSTMELFVSKNAYFSTHLLYYQMEGLAIDSRKKEGQKGLIKGHNIKWDTIKEKHNSERTNVLKWAILFYLSVI